MNKLLKMQLVSLGVALSAALAFGLSGNVSAVVDNDPDCDNVAIIRCGAFNMKTMREKASQGDVPRVFNAFGIKQSELDGKFVNGIVWRDGRVTVDGKVVATNAMTAGRNFGGTPIPNTNNAGKYPTSKFVTEGQTAFVKMINGEFSFAIIKACGNPVSATPKEKPQPEPEFECVKLTAEQISRTTYKFTAKATASGGANVEKYEFGFGDGIGVTVNESAYTYDYNAPGTYTATVAVHVKVNDNVKEVTAPACKVSVFVADEEIQVCDLATKRMVTIDKSSFDASKHSTNPADCQEKPLPPVETLRVCDLATGNTITIKQSEFDTDLHSRDFDDCKEDEPEVIASTGPATAIAGLLGSGSLGYGAYSYLGTRRRLINKFLGR